jgi:hypothetical protein
MVWSCCFKTIERDLILISSFIHSLSASTKSQHNQPEPRIKRQEHLFNAKTHALFQSLTEAQVKSSQVKVLLASPGVPVPHVTQDTSTLRDGLLFEARSACGLSVIGGVALHCGNLVEHLAGL